MKIAVFDLATGQARKVFMGLAADAERLAASAALMGGTVRLLDETPFAGAMSLMALPEDGGEGSLAAFDAAVAAAGGEA